MSLPLFALPDLASPAENTVLELDSEHVKHLAALRLGPGCALEVLLPSGLWRAELICTDRRRASIRLVAQKDECREAPIEIHACLPITAKMTLWAEFLPSVVELGASLIQPVIYERSQFDKSGIGAHMKRWQRIILAACEQSHRTSVPELHSPISVETLRAWSAKQCWVAYEVNTGEPNSSLSLDSFAFTHGPEGGITDTEIKFLREAGWKPLSLGKSIIRAVTCPSAILGAVQVEIGRLHFRV